MAQHRCGWLEPFSDKRRMPNIRGGNWMQMSKTALRATVLMAAVVGLSGCATRGYVDEQIATVNQRIDGVDARQQATDTRLQSVEATANNALTEARSASGQAQNATGRLDQLNARVDSLDQRMQQRTPRN
jgi:septal ring factor EnvC (AmiA/AmiB activator)